MCVSVLSVIVKSSRWFVCSCSCKCCTDIAEVAPRRGVDELVEDGPVPVRAAVPHPLPRQAPVLVAEQRLPLVGVRSRDTVAASDWLAHHVGLLADWAGPHVSRQLWPRRVQPHEHRVTRAQAQT